MTNPSAWAEAVEAIATALRAYDDPDGPSNTEAYAEEALRAALPHLMAAVVGEMPEAGTDLAIDLATACHVSHGDPDVDGRTVGEIVTSRVRAKLLAALTDAAGRVGG